MFRFLTAGESHGPALTAVIEGVPAGLPITAEPINVQLKRRQGGYGRGARQKIESDTAEILSGIRFGLAMGRPDHSGCPQPRLGQLDRQNVRGAAARRRRKRPKRSPCRAPAMPTIPA